MSAQPRALEQTLNVAVVLDAPETATMLLRPFRVEMLTPGHAGALLALAGHYGPEWMGGMLAVWFGERSRAYHDAELQRPEWLASLPGLCEALGGEDGVTRGLLTGSWRWLSGQIRSWLGYPAVSTREEYLGKLGNPLAGLLEATAVAGETGLRDEILGFLHERGDELRALLVSALRSATELSPADRSASGLDTLASLCASRLGELIARPVRAEDDWAITWRDTCGCELCVPFGEFLGDGSRRTLEWPLAEARRKHIRQSIRAAELPVRHQTLRAGSPYMGAGDFRDRLATARDGGRGPRGARLRGRAPRVRATGLGAPPRVRRRAERAYARRQAGPPARRRKRRASPLRAATSRARSTRAVFARPRAVLVVDDEDAARGELRAMLTELGLVVEAVDDRRPKRVKCCMKPYARSTRWCSNYHVTSREGLEPVAFVREAQSANPHLGNGSRG